MTKSLAVVDFVTKSLVVDFVTKSLAVVDFVTKSLA